MRCSTAARLPTPGKPVNGSRETTPSRLDAIERRLNEITEILIDIKTDLATVIEHVGNIDSPPRFVAAQAVVFHVHNCTANRSCFPCTTDAHSVPNQCSYSAHRNIWKRDHMAQVTGWTGRTACALQAALRLSNEGFAERLGIGVRTVAAWHQKPSLRPRPEMQQVLDTALEQASPAIKERFSVLWWLRRHIRRPSRGRMARPPTRSGG